ncbi:hypothetical protein Mpsy_1802 [Methanolobus psychrophilus R15]|nr:hypothetical protein Mpsy_1802 [Methanolobus psychrophilus R15]
MIKAVTFIFKNGFLMNLPLLNVISNSHIRYPNHVIGYSCLRIYSLTL